MLSVIRTAATSVRSASAARMGGAPLANFTRRAYSTGNGDAEKPADKASDKDAEKTAEKTTEQTADKAAEKTEYKPADNTADKSTGNEDAESELVKQLAEKDKKLAELQDAYVRCLADQENLRTRTRKEITTAQEYAIQKFAKDLLDSVDILGMALSSVPVELRSKETASKSDIANQPEKLIDQLTNLYTGVSMTEAELVKTLKRHGVEQHNPEGEAFDPNKHQALFQTAIPDKEPGTVFSVQKLGYTLKGRVLRPAQVGVVSESQ